MGSWGVFGLGPNMARKHRRKVWETGTNRTDGHGQVGYRQAHIVHSVLMDSEDISVGVGRVVERRNEVLERVARLFGSVTPKC